MLAGLKDKLMAPEAAAEAPADPRDRDEAAEAIRGLIERIVLTLGEKRGEMRAVLHGDLGTILEWAGSRKGKRVTDTPRRGVSVSVVAGARYREARELFIIAGAGGSNGYRSRAWKHELPNSARSCPASA